MSGNYLIKSLADPTQFYLYLFRFLVHLSFRQGCWEPLEDRARVVVVLQDRTQVSRVCVRSQDEEGLGTSDECCGPLFEYIYKRNLKQIYVPRTFLVSSFHYPTSLKYPKLFVHLHL